MIRITTAEKISMASPDQTWSLVPGANHFDSEMPIAVATRLDTLRADGSITLEIIDGNGVVSEWRAPAKATE